MNSSSHAASIIIPKVAFSTEDPYPENPPIESQIILRLDPTLASRIHHQISQEGFPKDLQITFSTPRKATIRFQEIEKQAVLLDLPCIIESQKSIDKKQFYKIADISQMLTSIEPEQDPDLFPHSLVQVEALGWRWPHGITPPMKNVKSRRMTMNSSVAKGLTGEDVEAVIERLLLADREAVEVNFQVEEEDFSTANAANAGEDDISDLVADIEDNLMMMKGDEEDGEEDEEQEDEYSELGAEYGEQEDDDELANDMQSQFQSGMMEEQDAGGMERELRELEDEFQLSGPSESEAQEQQQQLESELMLLQVKLREKIQQLEQAPPNPLIRQRLNNAIEQLQMEIEAKKQLL